MGSFLFSGRELVNASQARVFLAPLGSDNQVGLPLSTLFAAGGRTAFHGEVALAHEAFAMRVHLQRPLAVDSNPIVVVFPGKGTGEEHDFCTGGFTQMGDIVFVAGDGVVSLYGSIPFSLSFWRICLHPMRQTGGKNFCCRRNWPRGGRCIFRLLRVRRGFPNERSLASAPVDCSPSGHHLPPPCPRGDRRAYCLRSGAARRWQGAFRAERGS